jgi:anti-anti-sigma factor
VFRERDEHPEDPQEAEVAVIRVDGGLFFATAEALEDRVRAISDGAHALVLSLEGVNFVDSQGSAKLTELHALTRSNGMTLRFARVKPHVRAVLEADGVIELIGADRIHGSVQHAVEAELSGERHPLRGA